MIVVDAEGRVIEANAVAEVLFGAAPAELVGQPVEALVPHDARARHRAHRDAYGAAPATRAMGTGLELEAQRRDGARVPVDVSLAPVPGGRGEVVAIVRDVTERRREEARLGYLAAVVQSCNDAVYSVDRNGGITAWNPAATALFGHRAADVLGWRGTRLFPEDRWTEQEAVLRRVLAGEALGHVETDILRNDGSTVPALLTVSPIEDGRGRVVGASVIARDITEQRLALATLADSEQRLRESQALAHVGSWVVDLATGVVQWSEELHRIHGVDPTEFEGTVEAALAFMHPEDRPAELPRTAVEGEFRIVRPDGTVRWLFSRGEAVVDARGAVIGMRGICQDVTERHDAAEAIRIAYERERVAAEQLRAADRMKDEFLATVSHELRTPLTTIIGFAPLLIDPPASVSAADVVERIDRNATEMLAMVERVLDFSRVTAGAVEVHAEPVSLNELVTSLLDGFTGPRVKFRADGIPAPVVADREATRHILDNLLSNAARFSPPDAPIEVTVAAAGDCAVVSVSDEGPGVPPELREKVFERFFRGNGQPAGSRGAGVGLAIARRYAELQGGSLWCEGNVFRFTLPLA